MHEWESLSHVRWECKYHVVIVPKYRRKVIYGKLIPMIFRTDPTENRAYAPAFRPPPLASGRTRSAEVGFLTIC